MTAITYKTKCKSSDWSALSAISNWIMVITLVKTTLHQVHNKYLPAKAMFKDLFDSRTQNPSNKISDRLSDRVISGKRVLFAPLIQNFHQFSRKPTLVPIQFT